MPRITPRYPQSEERTCGSLIYTLKRSSRRRLSIQVTEDARVVVHANASTRVTTIDAFVSEHHDWIARQLKRAQMSPRYRAASASASEQEEWKQLIAAFVPEIVRVWERRLGVKAGLLAYRNMKSRWGSCNVKTGRICINTRLALYPPECLEYVVVHELCHLIEANHGKGFHDLMDAVMPDWKERRRRLE